MKRVVRSLLALSLAASALAVACKRDAPEAVSPDDPKPKKPPKVVEPPKSKAVPDKHRAAHEACDPRDTPAPGTMKYEPMPPTPLGPACKTKADCKAKPNGRCAKGNCTWDGCYEDKDCKDGKTVCTCEQDGEKGYYCKSGDCAIDADCPESGFCSPSWSSTCGAFLGVVGWYCHTKRDECTNDSECTKGEEKGYCAFDPDKKHWRCGYGHCVG